MPGHHLIDGRLHPLGVEGHAQVQAAEIAVHGQVRIELGVEQHAGLEPRQRIRILDARGQTCLVGLAEQSERLEACGGRRLVGSRLVGSGLAGSGLPHVCGQLANGLTLKDAGDGNLEPLRLGPCDHPDAGYGIAAQREEVVVDADALDTEGLRPDGGQGLLHRRGGRRECGFEFGP